MGKGSDNSQAKQRKLLTLQVDGEVYDISDFKHPGGSVIRFMSAEGVDATNAFREFHMRSGKADKYLKALPKLSGAAKAEAQARATKAGRFSAEEQARRDALTADFVAMRRGMEEEGLFDPSMTHVAYRYVEVLGLFAASFYLFSAAGQLFAAQLGSPFGFPFGSPALALVGAVLLGALAQGRCGWLMHEGGHYSLTGSIALDRRLQEVTYGAGCGMSAAWWRVNHNKHHATPQKLDADPDLETLPLVAFSDRISARVKPGSAMARWLSMQAYLFAPVSCALVGNFWCFYLHPRHMLRTKRYAELASVAARFVGWALFFSAQGYSPAQSAGLYFLTFGLACMYIFLNFAVSHTHLPVSEKDDYVHWVEYGALHTTNVSVDSAFVTWWMAHLNLQIEHHLFPSMPQFRHPRISERVRALFAKHNLKYDERTYVGAMRDTFANLHHAGQVGDHQHKQ